MDCRGSFSSAKLGDLSFINDMEVFKELSGQNIQIFEVASDMTYEKTFLSGKNVCDKIAKSLIDDLPTADVNTRILEGLPFCHSPLMIMITTKSTSKKGFTTNYRGIVLPLCSSDNESNVVWHSTLCVLDGIGIHSKVHNSFNKIFSCFIKPCSVTEEEFNWIFGIVTFESFRRNELEGIELVYNFPYLPKSAKVMCTIPDEECNLIWGSLQSCDSLVLSRDVVRKFWFGLEEHVAGSFGLNLANAKLTAFIMQTNMVKITSQLQLKIRDPQVLYSVLSFIQSDCLHLGS